MSLRARTPRLPFAVSSKDQQRIKNRRFVIRCKLLKLFDFSATQSARTESTSPMPAYRTQQPYERISDVLPLTYSRVRSHMERPLTVAFLPKPYGLASSSNFGTSSSIISRTNAPTHRGPTSRRGNPRLQAGEDVKRALIPATN